MPDLVAARPDELRNCSADIPEPRSQTPSGPGLHCLKVVVFGDANPLGPPKNCLIFNNSNSPGSDNVLQTKRLRIGPLPPCCSADTSNYWLECILNMDIGTYGHRGICHSLCCWCCSCFWNVLGDRADPDCKPIASGRSNFPIMALTPLPAALVNPGHRRLLASQSQTHSTTHMVSHPSTDTALL